MQIKGRRRARGPLDLRQVRRPTAPVSSGVVIPLPEAAP
jgi:hypothetical protein